jgi:hypothetical protein
MSTAICSKAAEGICGLGGILLLCGEAAWHLWCLLAETAGLHGGHAILWLLLLRGVTITGGLQGNCGS